MLIRNMLQSYTVWFVYLVFLNSSPRGLKPLSTNRVAKVEPELLLYVIYFSQVYVRQSEKLRYVLWGGNFVGFSKETLRKKKKHDNNRYNVTQLLPLLSFLCVSVYDANFDCFRNSSLRSDRLVRKE